MLHVRAYACMRSFMRVCACVRACALVCMCMHVYNLEAGRYVKYEVTVHCYSHFRTCMDIIGRADILIFIYVFFILCWCVLKISEPEPSFNPLSM